jgi:hypothetical protein
MKITKIRKKGGSHDQESNFGPPRYGGILIATQEKRGKKWERQREREGRINGLKEEES